MNRYVWILCAMVTQVSAADKSSDVQGMTVFGNREGPKSMVVMPWRDASSADMAGLKVESVLNEELSPIDPDQFRRRVELHEVLLQKLATH